MADIISNIPTVPQIPKNWSPAAKDDIQRDVLLLSKITNITLFAWPNIQSIKFAEKMIDAATLWQSKQAKTSSERKKKTRIFAIAGHAYLWQLENGRKKEEISKALKHHPLLKFFANWAVYLIHFRSKKRPAAKHSSDI